MTKEKIKWVIEVILSKISTRFLVWEGKLAYQRGDVHDFAHIMHGLMARSNRECGVELDNCDLVERIDIGDPMSNIEDFENFDLESWIEGQ